MVVLLMIMEIEILMLVSNIDCTYHMPGTMQTTVTTLFH